MTFSTMTSFSMVVLHSLLYTATIASVSLFPSSQPSLPLSTTNNIIYALSLINPYHLPALLRITLRPGLWRRSLSVLERLEGLKGKERILYYLVVYDVRSLIRSAIYDSSEAVKHIILRLLALAVPTLYTLETPTGDTHMSTSLFGHVFRLLFLVLQELSKCGCWTFPNSHLPLIPFLSPPLPLPTRKSQPGQGLTLGSLLSFPSLQERKVGRLSAARSCCIELLLVSPSTAASPSPHSPRVSSIEEYEDTDEEEQVLRTMLKRTLLQAVIGTMINGRDGSPSIPAQVEAVTTTTTTATTTTVSVDALTQSLQGL
ncbi:hypothetical protein BDQ12DRAFT_139258 [Crucibulum laeve]|uniref:Uncharacterized protein n=1 Tax=Crucibulum laeve TaxID=68775 RepID=A0A5C3LZC0_9AGAR|nr:hypothetical protein BDQ12DRAFT_139258 [Crucibulum laeve]